MLGECNDKDKIIEKKGDCKGPYRAEIEVFSKENRYVGLTKVDREREWTVPINNYDNIFSSMLTFFEISTLEMWPDMMFRA